MAGHDCEPHHHCLRRLRPYRTVRRGRTASTRLGAGPVGPRPRQAAGRRSRADMASWRSARRRSTRRPRLDHALDGSAAVINCAGPFRWTAAPVIEAALRAGIPYLDVAAEIEAVADTFAHYDEPGPRRRHRGRAGHGLLRRAGRPAGHRRDTGVDVGRRDHHRLRVEQLAADAGHAGRRQGLEATPRRTPHRLSQRTPRAPHRRRTDRRVAVPGAARDAEGSGRVHHGRLRHHPPPPRHARA